MDEILDLIITETIKYGPTVISGVEALFASGTPTLAQLQALHLKIASESYANLVPGSVLPPDANDAAAALAAAASPSETVTGAALLPPGATSPQIATGA